MEMGALLVLNHFYRDGDAERTVRSAATTFSILPAVPSQYMSMDDPHK
jgi:hypothetical protein